MNSKSRIRNIFVICMFFWVILMRAEKGDGV